MAHTTPAYIQQYYRLRDDSVGLNTNSGWLANENTSANIGMGTIFRARIKARETAGGATTTTFKAQVSKNGGAFVDMGVHQGLTTTAVIIVPSAQFASGDSITTEYLTSTVGNVNGSGEEDNATISVTLTSTETEFEFAMMIMRTYDGTDANVSGDTFRIRLVESGGTVFAGTYTYVEFTAVETTSYIGGCYVEGPNRIGPFADSNGNVYVLIENAESQALCRMMKSTDDGASWAAMDEAGSPATNDIESADIVQVGDTLHIAIHTGAEVFYNRFYTSDHATLADTWDNTIVDEMIITAITRLEDTVAMEVRSDGTVVCFYGRFNGSFQHLYYKIRSAGGTWGSEQTLDAEASTNFYWVTCVKGASDKIHIAYSDSTNGRGYHRSLSSADSLSAREQFSSDLGTSTADRQPILPLVYVDNGGTEVIYILFKETTGDTLDYVTVTNDGTPSSAANAGDNATLHNPSLMLSRQPVATAHQDGTDIHLLYANNADADLYYDIFTSGAWGTDTEEKDAVTVHAVRGRVFTHSSKVFGYVYENVGGSGASSGYTGYIWYDEIVLVTAITQTIGQVIETDTSQALSKAKAKAIGQSAEADTSQALARLKTLAIGQVIETDLAQAFVSLKTMVISQANETDLAQAVSKAGQTVAIGQSAETDAAQSLTSLKTAVMGQATEGDTAQSFSHLKTLAIGQANESDLAQTLASLKALAINQATESDLAQLMSVLKAAVLGQANETDTSQTVTILKTKAIAQANETDEAQPVSFSGYTILITQVTETDEAQSFSHLKVKAIGQSAETDAAQSFQVIKAGSIGIASESDAAQALSGLKAFPVGQVLETDIAQLLSHAKNAVINQASETDEAQPMAFSGYTILVGQASETDLAQSLTHSKLLGINQAVENNLAQTLTSLKVVVIGQATETNEAQPMINGAAIVAIYIATVLVNPSPSTINKANATPMANLLSNPTPTEEVKSG